MLELQQSTGIFSSAFDKSEWPSGYIRICLLWEHAGKHLFTQIEHKLEMRIAANPAVCNLFVHELGLVEICR
jgi:hypothetical protein